MPERISKGHMVDFLENCLRHTVASEGLSTFYALERAHRVPTQLPIVGSAPRPIVAQLLHYKDRDLILAQARLRGELKF